MGHGEMHIAHRTPGDRDALYRIVMTVSGTLCPTATVTPARTGLPLTANCAARIQPHFYIPGCQLCGPRPT
jgi:hypothetical protein